MINASVLPVYGPALNDAASSKMGEALLTLNGAGPPVSGAAGTGAGGAFVPFYYDSTNNVWYFNIGTAAAPAWAGVVLGDTV